MEVVKVFNKDGESYKRFETDVKNYRDFTLAWYKVCWPWMPIYSSIIPCVALFALPLGGIFVLNGWSNFADFVLIICMSFSVGVPLLRALNFVGKIPQVGYKIAEIEKLMDNPPLKQSNQQLRCKT